MNEAQVNGKALILIVDDIERNVLLLKDYCLALGYRHETALNAEEAIEKIKINRPDAILLDVFMPGLPGELFLEKLKKDSEYKDIPVIMISGVNEFDLVVKCIELGAADYLLKPVNMDLLKARLSACLREKEFHDREIQLYAELKASYDKLKRTEYMRDVLTHMIVHDLKNPLTSIKGSAELLQMMLDNQAGELAPLKSILSGAKQLQTLISQILDVSQMESGEMTLHIEDFDIAELLKKNHEEYSNLFELKKIGLRCNSSGSINVKADKIMIERVIQNLLINALKYSRAGTEATISSIKDGKKNELVISVRDQGKGIPKDRQDCIFDKFYQIDEENNNKKNRYGVGLGLYFCKMAIDKHNGKIWVESEGKDNGSLFSFSLPIIQG